MLGFLWGVFVIGAPSLKGRRVGPAGCGQNVGWRVGWWPDTNGWRCAVAISVAELMHLRTAYSALLTTEGVKGRFEEMCREKPELAEKRGREFEYVWDWVQSGGVLSDEKLRGLVPGIPPKELREITAATDVELFLFSGLLDVASFLCLFHRHHGGVREGERVRVLDFGAGCGRMVRFFCGNEARYEAYASEVNPAHVGWMRENLRGVRVLRNGVLPPLEGSGEGFDLIYSLSVLTHLNLGATDAWVEEMHARLRPGGVLIFTVHGDRALEITAGSGSHQELMGMTAGMARGIRANLKREGCAYLRYDAEVLRLANAGGDYGISVMDVEWVRRRGGRFFEGVELVAAAVRGWQDVVVMRRRG